MADTTNKDEKPEPTPAVKETDNDSLETTTTNDGSIAVNQIVTPKTDEPVKPTDPVVEEAKPAKVPATEPAKSPVGTEDVMVQTPTPEVPVVVSEADVAAAQKENDPHESLSEQIEVLTGEVQALEAKIEKLTSGVGEPTPTVMPVPEAPLSTPPTEPVKAEEPTEVPKSDDALPEKKEDGPIPATAPVEAAVTSTATPAVREGAKPINDIYDKILAAPHQNEAPAEQHKDLNDDATIEEGSTGLGTIGEVLVVFGLIALLILVASPFFKSTLGTNWEALKSIGWPTASISLALGFILFLFNKGRVIFKIFALILLIVAAVMTAAVFNYGSMLGPLSGLLDPIASFYK